MKRLLKTVCYLALSVLLVFFLTRALNLRFTAEGLIRDNEKGMHCGPSVPFLMEKRDGKRFYVGRVGERGISVQRAERHWIPFLWQLGEGSMGYREIEDGEHLLVQYETAYHLLYGLTDYEDADAYTLELGQMDETEMGIEIVEAYQFQMDTDGSFVVYLDGAGERFNCCKLTLYDIHGQELTSDFLQVNDLRYDEGK